MCEIRVQQSKLQETIKSVVNKIMDMHPTYYFSNEGVASTDGATIRLPEADSADCKDETSIARYINRTIGSGLHECLHVKYTDFDVQSPCDYQVNRFWHQLCNVVEDIRINLIGKDSIPSFAYWRTELGSSSGKRLAWRESPRTCTETDSFAKCLYYRASKLFDVLFLTEKQEKAEEPFVAMHESRLPTGLLQKSLEILRENLPKATCSGHSAQIAKRLLDLLKLSCKPESARSRTLTEVLQQAQRDYEIKLEAILASCKAAASADKSDVPASNAETSKGRVVKAEQSEPADAPTELDKPEFASLKQPAQFKPAPIGLHRSVAEYQTEWQKLCTCELSSVRKMMEKVFSVKTADNDSYELTEEGEELVGMVDWAATHTSRVFARETSVAKPAGELCILLDRSGSMGLKTMSLAKLASYALCECIDKVRGCDSEMLVFPGLGEDPVAQVKTRAQPLKKVAHVFPTLDAYGSTPCAEALAAAYLRMKQSKKALKLVVLITDGRFNHELVKEAYKALGKIGAELAVISIGIDNSSVFPTNYALVKNGAEIPSALSLVLKQTEFRNKLSKL